MRDKEYEDKNGNEKTKIYVTDTEDEENPRHKWIPKNLSTQEVKQFLDRDYRNKFSIKTSNPVAKARQMPDFEEDDWVVMEGTAMRVVKANEPEYQSLEDKLLNIEDDDSTDSQLPEITLPKNFFRDSYARMAGAYIRRLERSQHLKAVFNRFFDLEEFDSSDHQKKHTEIKSISAFLYGRENRQYTQFRRVTLNPDPITEDDLNLIRNGLGIELGSEDVGRILQMLFLSKKFLRL